MAKAQAIDTTATTMVDYYTGFTQAEVEAILTAQKAELAKVLASYSTSGDSVSKRAISEINEIIAGCQAALRKFNPAKYGRKHRTFTTRFSNSFTK